MDIVLLTLVVLSLGAAAGFGALAWRVGREEKARSKARIAALATAMDPPPPETSAGHARVSPEASGGVHPTLPWTSSSVHVTSPDQADETTSSASGPRVAVGSVFDSSREGIRGRPMLRVAVGGVMALGLVGGTLIGALTGGAPATRPREGAPLELVSMRHLREGTILTVSGLVRNPAAGGEVNGITAVVFAFDRNGGFVASGRAPLDFSTLAPGDESPFVVTVPNVSDVARYRVSFRTGRGVVRHIDRRTNQVQLAQAAR